MIEIKSTQAQKLNIGGQLYGEAGLYILKGSVVLEGNNFEPGQILVANNSTLCEFEIAAESTVYIFGGEPFPEERFIDWNFVASSKDLINEAKQRWKEQKFPKIPGDEAEFVPYPERDTLQRKG